VDWTQIQPSAVAACGRAVLRARLRVAKREEVGVELAVPLHPPGRAIWGCSGGNLGQRRCSAAVLWRLPRAVAVLWR
jgi:hypothetical protein